MWSKNKKENKIKQKKAQRNNTEDSEEEEEEEEEEGDDDIWWLKYKIQFDMYIFELKNCSIPKQNKTIFKNSGKLPLREYQIIKFL